MEALEIGLSPEELFYLLEELKLPDLPGVDRQAFGQLGSEQQALIRETAKHSLLARGLLTKAGEGVEINPLLLAMLGANFNAEHSVFLWRREGPQGQRMYFAHSWQNAHVLRWESLLGVHQFYLLNTPEALKKALLDLMELQPAPAGDEKVVRLPLETFERALGEAAERGAAQAASTLQAGGAPEAMARAVAADLAAGTNLCSLTGVHHAEPAGRADLALMVIQGGRTWLADYGEADTKREIAVRGGQPAEVEERLRAFFAAYAA
jgi:hypothetical protein